MDLGGRVAIVTGASSGIGEATARALARGGARVALCARRKDRLEGLAAALRAEGAACAVHALDVTDAVAMQRMVDGVLERWGAVDVLISNAGRGIAARFEETEPGEFRALLELNVMAVVTGIRAVLPAMRRQGAGHLITVSSIVGRRAVPYRAAYAATKFALAGLHEALRMELWRTGIEVSLVYPVYTKTEFHDVETQRVGRRRAGPVQSAEQVAAAILRCIRRPRPEVYPYGPARLLAIASTVAPSLVDRAMRALLR